MSSDPEHYFVSLIAKLSCDSLHHTRTHTHSHTLPSSEHKTKLHEVSYKHCLHVGILKPYYEVSSNAMRCSFASDVLL